jgi:hypothetical protein
MARLTEIHREHRLVLPAVVVLGCVHAWLQLSRVLGILVSHE